MQPTPETETEIEIEPVNEREMVKDYFLVASHCNAQKELSLPMLVEQIIDLAVYHANSLNIGYKRLSAHGLLWVLSRVTIEMRRMPRIEEPYRIVTWIESFRRMFSHRNFLIYTPEGEVLGYVRTLWAAIELESRRTGDLSNLITEEEVKSDRACPMAMPPKLREFNEASDIEHYYFRVTDIDFNRHVNSARYIELIVDHWSLGFYDRHAITYFDISYRHEAHFGERTAIKVLNEGESTRVELDGEDCCFCLAEMRFSPREA